MKPHKHAEVIKAWADGAEIEYEDCGWHNCTTGVIWDEETQYRIKPAAPKWPVTTMTSAGLSIAYLEKVSEDGLRDVANAAIANACESGALVPADKVREIEAKARAEGMREGSVWDTARDRMVARTAISMAIHSRGLVWDSSELDRIMEFIKK
jgi:hypothetical protein